MARPLSDDRRAALLSAAVKVFAERGLSAPTSAISREADVSEGSFFTYFKTKDELLNLLYRELRLTLGDAVMAGFPRRGGVRQRMEHIWTQHIAWNVAHPTERKVLRQLYLSTAITAEIRADGGALFAEVDRLEKDAREQRLLRDVPPEMVSQTLKALLDMAADLTTLHPRKADTYRTQGFEMFWAALSSRR